MPITELQQMYNDGNNTFEGAERGVRIEKLKYKKCPYSFKAIKISRITQFHFHLKTL